MWRVPSSDTIFPTSKDISSNNMKYFVYVISVIVAAAIIAGFFIVGSPAEERARRLDEERVWNLQSIQSEIVTYWSNKGFLPEGLEEMDNPLRGFSVPTDPLTGDPYEYEKLGDLEFSLCANFQTASREPSGLYPEVPMRAVKTMNVTWEHEEGDVCFYREIDPDFFDNKSIR